MQKNKSELDKSVDLSLCGLAPEKSQENLFLIHFARETNKGPTILTNQNKPCHACRTASAMIFHGHDN